MFTLQTSFKPLFLKGGGGVKSVSTVEVTVNSKEKKLLRLWSQLRPRIRPQGLCISGASQAYWICRVRHVSKTVCHALYWCRIGRRRWVRPWRRGAPRSPSWSVPVTSTPPQGHQHIHPKTGRRNLSTKFFFLFWEGGRVVMGKVNNLRLVDENLLLLLHFFLLRLVAALNSFGSNWC